MLRCCNVFVELKYFGAINKIYIVVQIGGWKRFGQREGESFDLLTPRNFDGKKFKI